jgi:aminoacrylate hydrolase
MSAQKAEDTLHYAVAGRSDAAAPVLLSSGLGGLAAYWGPQRPVLDAAYRVITYDQRGTGANPDNLPQEYGISDMADDVAAIMADAACGPVHFVGHALGGLIGLDLALRHPEKLASLVLINTWAKLDPHTAHCFDVRTAILRDSGPRAYVAAQAIFLHPAPYLSGQAERLRREEDAAVVHFQGVETLTRRIAALRAFDIVAHLPRITMPTLILAARDDMLVPWTCSQILADGIPSARLVTFDYGGHANNVTDPESFNAVLLASLALIDGTIAVRGEAVVDIG